MKNEIDVTAVKRSLDIVEYIGRKVNLRRSGKSFVGFCPLHKNTHTAALAVFPETQTWKCFGACNTGGDIIAWVMKTESMAFKDALAYLGNAPATAQAAPMVAAVIPPAEPPGAAWQEHGREFIAACEQALHAETVAGQSARQYLTAERGLSLETIRRFRLGLNIQARRADWGMPDGDVWLHCGLTIPCFEGDTLWYIKVRRPRGCKPKYLNIRGSQPTAVFNSAALRRRVAVLTEGEFDAMLTEQHAGQLVGVGTLGPQGYKLRLERWGKYLFDAELVLLCYDDDGKSENGAAAMLGMSARARRVHLPTMTGVKDITDYWRSGGAVFSWLNQQRQEQLGRLWPEPFEHFLHLREVIDNPHTPASLRADFLADLIEFENTH